VADIDDRPICHMPLVTSRKPLAESQPTVSSPPAAPSSRATLEAIKKQGRAKVKTARGAQDRERATAAEAEQQWKDAFDFLFDSSADPATCGDFLVGGRTVLVMIPGFNSWTSLQPSDVECWKKAALLKSPDGSPSALSLVFRWPCGAFLQSSDDAHVESIAAWADAHEATRAAATNLTRLLRHLVKHGSRVVVAAHSLGARVALQALSNDLAAPNINGLIIAGGAVDDHALVGGPGVPAEFPFGRLMKKCGTLSLVYSRYDPMLKDLWPAAEYGRAARTAPAAIGSTGPVLGADAFGDAAALDEWADRVLLLDVAEDMAADSQHGATDYLLTPGGAHGLRAALFPPAA